MTRISAISCCILVLFVGSAVYGQEKNNKQDAKQASNQIEIQSNFSDQIRKMIADGDIIDASELVDQARRTIGEHDASNSEIQVAYQILVTGLVRIQNVREAYRRLTELLELQLETIDDELSQARLTTTLVGMRAYASRLRKTDELLENVNRSIEAISQFADYNEITPNLSRLSVMKGLKSELLVAKGRQPEAIELFTDELKKTKTLHEAKPDNPTSAHLLARSMGNLMRAGVDSERQTEIFTQLRDFVSERLAADPSDTTLTIQFVGAALFRVGKITADDPEAARQLITEARGKIEAGIEADPQSERAYAKFLNNLKLLEVQIEANAQIQKLIGTQAPNLDAKYWINGDEINDEQLEGKVILLNFWAIWDAPSVRTFPQLKKLSQDFADKDLQIIGVTRHFNFQWDEKNRRPQRSREKVEPEDENQMLEKFLDRIDVSFPTIVTPGDSAMQREFKVVRIPFVALLDKQGKIRMIEFGVTNSNASKFDEKIKELLGEE